MPFLILSDIHANLEALEAVIDDAAGRYDRILCLGDLVGYGADPNAVVEWTRENVAVVIRGNHDRASAPEDPAGFDAIDNFSPTAQTSTHWTRRALLPENRAYLESLPRGPLPYQGVDLVHGSPADEDEYVVTIADAAPLLAALEAPLTFFGHTHKQGGFLRKRRMMGPLPAKPTIELEPDYFYLVNPGSVGQPRDGDPRAAYAASPTTSTGRRPRYGLRACPNSSRLVSTRDFSAASAEHGAG
jgi:predicted phosphodiesterase